MEATLYHDEPSQEQSGVKQLKRTMTLDFNGPAGQTKRQKIQTALLQSPDLNMLKLASPELEKMIIQANGMVTTTPTPTQFLFPKHVTDEQEAYAQGFVAALAELHGNYNGQCDLSTAAAVSNALTLGPLSGVNLTFAPASTESSGHTFTTTTSLPGGLINLSDSSNIPSVLQGKSSLQSRSMSPLAVSTKIKEEPQTVPCGINSPPLSPIDMENQERIKLERKRARNRVAARKCRTRKLERISRLEDKLQDIKDQNNGLASAAAKLRDEVCGLKKTIIEHVNSGCQIMMTHNISF